MNMRKMGVKKASKRAHTGLCLSVKEAHFFRLYAERAAVNKITYGGGNLIRILLGNHAGSRKQRKESKNAKKAITLAQTGVVMGEDCKLPDIKAGRCELTEAFVLDRKWSPPKAHRRSIKSTFGPQILSKRITSPSFGFGTGSRNAREKVFPGAEAAKRVPGNFSPGPAYKVLSSFGRQAVSNKESPPVASIGNEIRWQRRRCDPRPGPGTYNQKSSFGPQVVSEKKSPEICPFGKGTRDQAQHVYLSQEFDKAKFGTESPGPKYKMKTSFGPHFREKQAPIINFTRGPRTQFINDDPECAGPGQYESPGSVGKQADSKKVTFPAVGFPLCSREKLKKDSARFSSNKSVKYLGDHLQVYLSKEHDRANLGQLSPGPALYKGRSSIYTKMPSGKVSCSSPEDGQGLQALSNNLNPPYIGFTRDDRWRRHYEDMPGPGAYDC